MRLTIYTEKKPKDNKTSTHINVIFAVGINRTHLNGQTSGRAGGILFYPRLFEAYESGGNGVDGEAGHGVDVEFSRNILAVGEHRVE